MSPFVTVSYFQRTHYQWTQNSATVQSSFWVFLIIQSEFKWNKRVTCFFLCRSWQAANCKNHLFPPLKPLCQRTGWRWPRTTQLPPPTRVVGFFFQCKKEKNNNRVLQSRHEISIWVYQGYCQIPATSLTETTPPTPQLFFSSVLKKTPPGIKKEKKCSSVFLQTLWCPLEDPPGAFALKSTTP